MAPSVADYTLVDTALAQALAKIRVRRKSETVPASMAYRRVSAEDVLAPNDVPRYSSSHWDGFAAISADLVGATDSSPVSLKLVGNLGPGARPRLSVKSGDAVRVATGAPLPTGADTVVPVESARVDGQDVLVNHPSPPGSHVFFAGEDVKKDERVLERGETMRAQDLGLLIALGIRELRVWRRPKVTVMATGSELTDVRRPRAGKVVNSHSPVFLRLLDELGCTAVDLGTVKDDPLVLSRKLRTALNKSDFVLSLGGTSAGEHDYATEAVARLDPEMMVHGVKMDRGRVTGLSVVKGKPILMMPGPIQGAMNAFLLLGLPIIEVLSGTRGKSMEIPCAFGGSWGARSRYADFRKVVYVRLEGGPELVARPLGAETESMKVLAEADGYVVVPENVTRIESGGRVNVSLLPGFSFA